MNTLPPLRYDLQAIANLIQVGEKVLDLGCGDGILLRHLMDTRGIIGRGIELSETGVLTCVQRGVSVRQGNLHEGLGVYPDGSFDTVILSQTIHFLNDPVFILCEMLRVGRRAIVSFPNWGYWRWRLNLLFTGRIPVGGALPTPWDSSPRARPITIRDFKNLCHQHDILIKQQIFLNGTHQLRSAWANNLCSTIAVMELGSAIK